MSVSLTFHITLHSDYHIGAGYGNQGTSIDSALQRDADGVPVIRGTTLTGLLRDGLQRLAALPPMQEKLDSPLPPASTQQPDQPNRRRLQAADQLFGAPQQPKRWRVSSARPLEMLNSQAKVINTTSKLIGSHAAAHVRVNPATRRAEARKLFIREEADQRWIFAFTIDCNHRDDKTLSEAALLTACARMIEHLGAGRRRGRGRCTFQLVEIKGYSFPQNTAHPTDIASPSPQELLLQLFEDCWLQNKPAPSLYTDVPRVDSNYTAIKGNTPLRFLLLLRTDEPILLAKRAEAGNQFETLDYLPGFIMRGALATLSAQRCRLEVGNSAVYQEFVRLFARQGLRCSNLLPAQQDGSTLYPTIPPPEDLFFSERHPKHKSLLDAEQSPYPAQQAAANDFKETVDGESLKLEPVKQRFITVKQDAALIKVAKTTEMHVTIDEKSGRAQDANLFGYVTLAAGQYFLGELVCQDATDWANLQAMAGLPELSKRTNDDDRAYSPPFQLRLGKAQRRGYGKVTLVFMQSPTQDPWSALPLSDRLPDPRQPFTLTLLSDAIVTDVWGRYIQGFSEGWLSDVLGVSVKIEEVMGRQSPHRLAFAQPNVIDTFNNHVGLPRPRDLALRAGSAVTLRINDNNTTLTPEEIQQKLITLEANGIGLRRDEGFGRVVINHPVYQQACMGVDSNDQYSPASLSRLDDLKTSAVGKDEHWQRQWEEKLKANQSLLNRLQSSHFAGLTRELAVGQVESQATAEQLLQAYGTPEKDQLFVTGRFNRQKPNPFTDDTTIKKGFDALRQLLNLLSEHAGEDARCWRLGSQTLANWMGIEQQQHEGGW